MRTIRCQFIIIGGQFGVSSSLLLPLHQVGKLDSWEDFQDRQAMTLFTTRSTAGTTEPMSSAPTANGICSLAISPASRQVSFALRLLLDVQPFSSASQAGPRAVDQPHPPVPDRRSHLAAPPETGNQRPRLAGPLPIPGHPGRRPPARRSEVHRGQPGAGRDGGRSVRVYLVEPPLPWRRAADPILDSFPEWEQLGRTEPERRARWRRKVRGEQPAKELDGVRSSVRSGRPYGAEDWVEVISHRLGIVREPRRRGRPPREKML